jgi:competence protein ComEC
VKSRNRWLLINSSLAAVLLLLFFSYIPYLVHFYALQKGCVVSFIDVGQGDSTLIQMNDGTNILIDGGELFNPGDNSDSFKKDLGPFLQKRRIKKLDVIIATHPHSDHIGGLVEVLKSCQVGLVIDGGRPHTSFLYEKFRKCVKIKKIPFLVPSAGQELAVSRDGRLLFLSPPRQTDFGSLNDNSLVVKFVYKKVSFLFAADAGLPAEKWMLQNMKGYLKSDVLKVGHHGSRTSSGKDFIGAVAPSIAVIPCGEDNAYGFPDKSTLQVLGDARIRCFRTDTDGTISVRTDGEKIELATEK